MGWFLPGRLLRGRRRVELLLHGRAGGEGDDLLSGPGDLLSRWQDDDPGFLFLGSEDTEPAELDAGTFDQAADEFVEERLDDLAGEVQRKVELGGDPVHQVVFDHGVSEPRSTSG